MTEKKALNFKPAIGFIFVAFLAIMNIILGIVFFKESWLGAVFAFIVAAVMLLMMYRLAKQKR
jgi:membrane associated rhomboid family serine protease